jgi:hypothetical protein
MFISTPILAFPQGGRNKTFPPWGKMKGGKKSHKTETYTEVIGEVKSCIKTDFL